MIETPEKTKELNLLHADSQRGYFFTQKECDPSLQHLFGAVGRLENDGSAFIVQIGRSVMLMSARHCLVDLVVGRKRSASVTMPSGYRFEIMEEDRLVTPEDPFLKKPRDVYVTRLPHVDSENLPDRLVLRSGDNPLRIRTGDVCFSIGYPRDFIKNSRINGPVLSAGRVSTVGVTLLEHSNRIEPGNSGSPLLNINGQVIGVNVKNYSPDDNNKFDLRNIHNFQGAVYNPSLVGLAERTTSLWH